MRILRHQDPDFSSAIAALNRRALPAPDVEETVRGIIEGVRSRRDAALLEFTEKFDRVTLTAETLRETGDAAVGEKIDAAIRAAHANVRDFALQSLRKSWSSRNAQGAMVGERFDPFERVGIYIPGGTAPLVSTAIMTVTLAAAAGVPEIVVTTPAGKDGTINSALLHAVRYAGATEVYKVGGAQAIAAMAYGTATIAPVQKIFGPGNAFVVEAKRQVFGAVSIDLLPGPSEILIIADETANPAWVAADLLAQAEHGKGSQMVFLTDSERLLTEVEAAVRKQCAELSRQQYLAEVLESYSTLILVPTLDAAVDLANAYSAEHVAVVTRNASEIATRLRTSGAIFLGPYSPVAAGDFLAGPSHTLPTGGAGKSFPGLTVDMFQRRTSIVELDEQSLRASVDIISAFSEVEGLDAHGRSGTIRLE
ncbi:MAG: histidinol dehydrogenase [Chthoniobacteraceae bacterium]